MTPANRAAIKIMPLSHEMKEVPGAPELWNELARLTQVSRSASDFLIYNYGTATAVISSGGATVLAGFGHPLAVAILAGVATVLFSLTKILQFGSRWAWGLERQSKYSSLIYQLNAAVCLDEDQRSAKVLELYGEMALERLRDSQLPGTTDASH